MSDSTLPIGSIKTNTGDVFTVKKWLGDGGSGVVYRAQSATDPEHHVAVKFYLVPEQKSIFETTAQAFWDDIDAKAIENERLALRALRHPGIQEVLGWGEIDNAMARFSATKGYIVPKSDKVQFLVSSLIDGPSLGEWIEEFDARVEDADAPERKRIRNLVISGLVDICDALVYLHEEKFHQHSDLRTENIRVNGSTQRPILIDFGYSQVFSSAVASTNPNTRVPPLGVLNGPEELRREVEGLIKKIPGGKKREIKREELGALIFPGLDIYQFGRLLEGLLQQEHGIQRLISPLDVEFLTLLFREMATWSKAKEMKTSDIRNQLRKLVDGYWTSAVAPHAPQAAPGQTVRRIVLPESSFIASRIVERIIEATSFRRLQALNQLSLIQLVYPGATQSRFEHSLSVYSAAVELVSSLTRSPRFTRLFDTTSISYLLATALLHDINHFPFLHYCQEAKLEDAQKTDLFDYFIRLSHAGAGPSIADILDDSRLDPKVIVAILGSKYESLSEPYQQVIKSAVDSGADIDKLSYVYGDAKATGVPFGLGVDRVALLSAVDVLRQDAGKDEQYWHICYEPNALSAVESLLLARYWNFKRIYWHHTNRAIGAMITHVLRQLRNASKITLSGFIENTMGYSDIQALAYLDTMYRSAFGDASILDKIQARRQGIFKRLLSVRAVTRGGGGLNSFDIRRNEIYENLREANESLRDKIVIEFSRNLSQVFPAVGGNPLVLLDIPGRPLDQQMGQVYVANLDMDGKSRGKIESPFIDILQAEFLKLSQTVRLFISSEVRDSIGKSRIAMASGRLEELLQDAIKTASRESMSTVR